MSTKIYEAYRFPRSRVDEFIRLFNKACQKGVTKALLKYGKLNRKGLKKTRDMTFGTKRRKSNKVFTDQDMGIIWMFANWIMASKSPYKDIFDFDCSFNMWMKGPYCYVIPYVSRAVNLKKAFPQWCQSYSYWDNTDPEEGVSEAAWDARGKIWDAITDDWDQTRLQHVVFEFKMPSLNGFQGMLVSLSHTLKKDKDLDWVGRTYNAASCLYWKMDEEEKKRKFEEAKAREKEAEEEIKAKEQEKAKKAKAQAEVDKVQRDT